MGQDSLHQTEMAFDALCAALDERHWYYEKDKDNFRLNVKANGQDLFMELDICCDRDKRIVTMISHLPFTVPEERRVEMAQAISYVNAFLGEGSFDYHYKKGLLFYRMASSYRGSVLSKLAFDRMIMMSFLTVDQYNDKLLLYSLGSISLSEFVKKIGT